MSKATNEEVRSIPCVICRAQPEQQCKYADGTPRNRAHKERVREADNTKREKVRSGYRR